MRLKFDERILESGKPFKQALFIKQANGVAVFHSSTIDAGGTAVIYGYFRTKQRLIIHK